MYIPPNLVHSTRWAVLMSLSAALMTACSGAKAPDAPAAFSAPSAPPAPIMANVGAGPEDAGNATGSELELKPLIDAEGRQWAAIPLPASWQIHPTGAGKQTISAPGGVFVHATTSSSYGYADSSAGLQVMRSRGAQLSPVVPINSLVQQVLQPKAAAEGYALVETYPLPRLQRFLEAYFQSIPHAGVEVGIRAAGVDWSAAHGGRSLTVLVQKIFRTRNTVSWVVESTRLDAPAPHFEDAKLTFLGGVTNIQLNPAMLQQERADMAQSSRQFVAHQRDMQNSVRLHQQRMAAIRSAGAAALEAGKANSAALDRSFDSWKQRSAMRDAGHQASVDAIRGVSAVSNPETRQQYEVESGYQHYWHDGDNGYIGTDDAFFDPRTNPQLNNQPWSELVPADD